MLISIIVPIYNAEKYMRRCINSIISQTYTNYELILVDDGSIDNSGTICDEYAQMNNKIKVIHQVNSGPGPSRNNGLSYVTGNYILFVDSDDFIYSNTLETLSEAAQKNNYPDAILFDYVMGNEEHYIKRSTLPKTECGFVDTKNALLNSAGSTWCKMYKTSLIISNSIIFPALPRKEDFVFNKAALSYCDTVFYVKEHMYFYFNNNNSIVHTTSFSEKVQQAAFECLTKQISIQYKELIDVLKINNYIISAVQNMCIKRININQIKKKISDFESKFPSWVDSINELVLSNEAKFCLFLIHKKQIFILKKFFLLRETMKKYFNKRTGE